ncbi:hypothetical protein ACOSQ4_004504 [Xanthoceras sorbifolium]
MCKQVIAKLSSLNISNTLKWLVIGPTMQVTSQVLENEHRGRIRGLGFGITPTRVQAAVISKQTTTQLQEDMKALRQQMAEMKFAFFTIQGQYSSASNRQGSNKIAKIIESSLKSSPGVSINEMDASSQKGKKMQAIALDW